LFQIDEDLTSRTKNIENLLILTHQALTELLSFKAKKIVREQQHENVLEMQIAKIHEEV
jgi:hypothetical protein